MLDRGIITITVEKREGLKGGGGGENARKCRVERRKQQNREEGKPDVLSRGEPLHLKKQKSKGRGKGSVSMIDFSRGIEREE